MKFETFDFLGFTYFCDKTRKGKFKLGRKMSRKKFKAEIKHRTRRQQPKNLEMVIASINPVIRGWGNYFRGGMVKKRFDEEGEAVRPLLYSTNV